MVGLSTVGRRLLKARGTSLVLDGIERLGTWPPGRLCTLTYHRVTEVTDDGRHPGLISATPSEFDRHLDILQSHFNVVSLDTVMAARADRDLLPPGAVLLTFDDAVDDFVDHALPALVAHGLPAVLFVPTGYVDRSDTWFWWDAVHAAVMKTDQSSTPVEPIGRHPLHTEADRTAAFGELREHFKRIPWADAMAAVGELTAALGVSPPPADVMSWADVRKAAEAGISVCPHTRSHPHLDQLDPADVRAEIAGSLEDLREQLGTVPPVFAYPSGQWTPEVRAVVEDLDFELAFTTRRAAHRIDSDDPLLIGRFNVSRRTGMNALRIQMLPWSDRVQRPDRSGRSPEGGEESNAS